MKKIYLYLILFLLLIFSVSARMTLIDDFETNKSINWNSININPFILYQSTLYVYNGTYSGNIFTNYQYAYYYDNFVSIAKTNETDNEIKAISYSYNFGDDCQRIGLVKNGTNDGVFWLGQCNSNPSGYLFVNNDLSIIQYSSNASCPQYSPNKWLKTEVYIKNYNSTYRLIGFNIYNDTEQLCSWSYIDNSIYTDGTDYTVKIGDGHGAYYNVYVDDIYIYDSNGCIENWTQDINMCNNYERLISYSDNNTCNTYNDLPVNNGTFESCNIVDSCNSYTLNNSIIKINLTSISGNPCLSMDLDNVTLFCDTEIIGTNTETFMTITNIKNSEIKNCKITNVLQGILINAFTLIDNAINNKFDNITINTLDSGAIGIDAQPYIMTNTTLNNINLSNCYSNWCLSLVNMNEIKLNNVYADGYSSLYAVLVNNLIIDNSIFYGGTIYSALFSTCNNVSISNTNFIDSANNNLVFDSCTNVYLYNNKNSVNHLGLYINQFDTIATSFNPLSSYNIGWFPCDYTIYQVTNINELCFYNGTNKGYNNDGSNWILNKSIEYFINPKCINNWEKTVQPCINNAKIINYADLNDCNDYSNIPISNNTYETCQVLTNVSGNVNYNFNIDNELLPLIILIIFFILTFGVATKSTGKMKALFSASGIFLIMISLILFTHFKQGLQPIYAIFYLIFPIFIDLLAIGLILIGIFSFFSEDK